MQQTKIALKILMLALICSNTVWVLSVLDPPSASTRQFAVALVILIIASGIFMSVNIVMFIANALKEN